MEPSAARSLPELPAELVHTLSGGAEPDLVLMGRQGCHLCDVAERAVPAVAAEQGLHWVGCDLDEAMAAAPHLAVLEAYTTFVPVLFVRRRPVAWWHISADDVIRATAGLADNADGRGVGPGQRWWQRPWRRRR